MDDRRFDDLLRALVTGPASRRGMVRLLGAGALAGRLVGLRTEGATAGCGKVRDKCERSGDCCKGARCANGRCKCKRGWDDCDENGRCEDLRSDEAKCGSCTNPCGGDETCCRGSCVNLRTDPNNCGLCNRVCSGCVNGACTCPGEPCPDGCSCQTRRGTGNGAVCAGDGPVCDQDHTQCTSDADCTALGTVCLSGCSASGPSYCSNPCLK